MKTCIYSESTVPHSRRYSGTWAEVFHAAFDVHNVHCRMYTSCVQNQSCSEVTQCNICKKHLRFIMCFILNYILATVCLETFDFFFLHYFTALMHGWSQDPEFYKLWSKSSKVDFESGKFKKVVFNIQMCMRFFLGQCEPITLELCMNLPYNHTHYPNYLGHGTQKEASISWESSLFPALVQTNCYKYLMFFACTILVPKCDVKTGQRIPPCRYNNGLSTCYLRENQKNTKLSLD